MCVYICSVYTHIYMYVDCVYIYIYVQFGLKFATVVNNLNIVNQVNRDYIHNDSDFNKGFIQKLITLTTNVNRDDCALLMQPQIKKVKTPITIIFTFGVILLKKV